MSEIFTLKYAVQAACSSDKAESYIIRYVKSEGYGHKSYSGQALESTLSGEKASKAIMKGRKL